MTVDAKIRDSIEPLEALFKSSHNKDHSISRSILGSAIHRNGQANLSPRPGESESLLPSSWQRCAGPWSLASSSNDKLAQAGFGTAVYTGSLQFRSATGIQIFRGANGWCSIGKLQQPWKNFFQARKANGHLMKPEGGRPLQRASTAAPCAKLIQHLQQVASVTDAVSSSSPLPHAVVRSTRARGSARS